MDCIAFILTPLPGATLFSTLYYKYYLLEKDQHRAESKRFGLEVRLPRHVPGIQKAGHSFVRARNPLQVEPRPTYLLKQAGSKATVEGLDDRRERRGWLYEGRRCGLRVTVTRDSIN